MLDDINDIINKNLPAQVGEVLKQRLIKADQDANKLKDALTAIDSLKVENNALKRENDEAKKILLREQVLVADEAKLREAQYDLDKQTAVLKAQSLLINTALERDERILGLVFGNNRFKYTQNVQEQVAFAPQLASAQQPCPYPQTAQQSRSVVVEGEGQVPAQPTGPITPQR